MAFKKEPLKLWPNKIEIDGKMQNIVGMVFLPKGYRFFLETPPPTETIEWNCKGFLGYKK